MTSVENNEKLLEDPIYSEIINIAEWVEDAFKIEDFGDSLKIACAIQMNRMYYHKNFSLDKMADYKPLL